MTDRQQKLDDLAEKLAGLRLARARRAEAVENLTRQILTVEREIADLSEPSQAVGLEAQAAHSADLRYGSVRNEIVRLLSETFDGIDSVGLGRSVRERFGDRVSPRTHLATLKRLKEAGLATKVAGRWLLTGAGMEEANRLRR